MEGKILMKNNRKVQITPAQQSALYIVNWWSGKKLPMQIIRLYISIKILS